MNTTDPNAVRIDGRLLQAICESLEGAFTLAQLDRLLRFEFGVRRETLSVAPSLREIVFTVAEDFNLRGRLRELVLAAHLANPGNEALSRTAGRLGLTALAHGGAGHLEHFIAEHRSYQDSSAWLHRFGELENRVGRVDVPGSGSATAFLIGPDLALTCHHVLAQLWRRPSAASGVRVQFDYRLLPVTGRLPSGTTYRLAERWLVDSSPPSRVDLIEDPGSRLPSPDELDYVIFRLRGRPGEDPVGGSRLPDTPQRGWIGLAEPHTIPAQGQPLLILQHPLRQPLKLGFDLVMGVNANRTRIRHGVHTEGGSSGSPCFDAALDLVAVHQSSDPAVTSTGAARFNQAVPAEAIARLLAQREISLGGTYA